jgi:hypothetical protein
MGGESHYQVKIPSNQINNINNYHSNFYSTFEITPLDPYFVTGFQMLSLHL